jgi:hypothetical protein
MMDWITEQLQFDYIGITVHFWRWWMLHKKVYGTWSGFQTCKPFETLRS